MEYLPKQKEGAIPVLFTPLRGFEEATFTASRWSRSKKSADHAAAEKALAFRVSKGLLKAPLPPSGADVAARPSTAVDITMRDVRDRLLMLDQH